PRDPAPDGPGSHRAAGESLPMCWCLHRPYGMNSTNHSENTTIACVVRETEPRRWGISGKVLMQCRWERSSHKGWAAQLCRHDYPKTIATVRIGLRLYCITQKAYRPPA